MASIKSSFTPKLTRRLSKIGNKQRSSSSTLNGEKTDWKKSAENSNFLEPQTLKRSLRKRRLSSICEPSADSSFSSLNESVSSVSGTKRRLTRMSSLAGMLSPAKQFKKMLTRAKSVANLVDESNFDTPPIQRSPSCDGSRSSFKQSKSNPGPATPNTCPEPRTNYDLGFTDRRAGSLRKKARASESMKRNRTWLEKFKEEMRPEMMAKLSYWELKRQEAIYELYKGEKYLVRDLEMIVSAYKNSLITLKILQEEEAEQIFGPADALRDLHVVLNKKLKSLYDPSTKLVKSVGEVLSEWVKDVKAAYIPYLCNLSLAKDLLDSKKANSKQLQNFLDLCLKSDFSRRLDLWNFLDVPRSKLMKYPLLLKSILKQTPEDHLDKDYLPSVIEEVENVIRAVDQKTGEANCRYVMGKIDFSGEHQREPFLDKAKTIQCQGELKNNRGTKLYGFLFDTGFLLTRPVEVDEGTTRYKAHKQPISGYNIQITEQKENENRSGSFKSTFSYSSQGKSGFQVHSITDEKECFILVAANEHDKREWLQRFKEVKASCVSAFEASSTITAAVNPLHTMSPISASPTQAADVEALKSLLGEDVPPKAEVEENAFATTPCTKRKLGKSRKFIIKESARSPLSLTNAFFN